MRILIVDDHAIVRRGLKEILMHDLGPVHCGEAKDAQQFLGKIFHEAWDLVILDVTMPGRSGLDALTDAKRIHPKLPILVLSMHSEGEYGRRALKAGAAGYVNKESAPEELIKAIQKVLASGIYVSPALAENLASNVRRDEGVPVQETLTTREFEILRMMASGQTVSNIAGQLHLSVHTVSTYRARILEKLHLETTAELIRYAILNHLVD